MRNKHDWRWISFLPYRWILRRVLKKNGFRDPADGTIPLSYNRRNIEGSVRTVMEEGLVRRELIGEPNLDLFEYDDGGAPSLGGIALSVIKKS